MPANNEKNGDLTTSEIVWILASLSMIAALIWASDIFMVLLLPWIMWGLAKDGLK